MKNVSSDTKKNRGRPPRLNREDSTAAAEALFHRFGYDQVGMSKICDVLDVGQPAVYRLFGNKAGLFNAALDRYASSVFAAKFAQEIQSAETIDDLHRNLTRCAVDLYTAMPDRLGCMALETAFGSSDAGAKKVAMTLVDQLQRALELKFGALGAADPTASAHSVLMVLIGLSSLARSGVSAKDLEAGLNASVVVEAR